MGRYREGQDKDEQVYRDRGKEVRGQQVYREGRSQKDRDGQVYRDRVKGIGMVGVQLFLGVLVFWGSIVVCLLFFRKFVGEGGRILVLGFWKRFLCLWEQFYQAVFLVVVYVEVLQCRIGFRFFVRRFCFFFVLGLIFFGSLGGSRFESLSVLFLSRVQVFYFEGQGQVGCIRGWALVRVSCAVGFVGVRSRVQGFRQQFFSVFFRFVEEREIYSIGGRRFERRQVIFEGFFVAVEAGLVLGQVTGSCRRRFFGVL